jgi:SsrA-binding protein
MHKKEILRLFSKMREKGLTLVPLRLYFSPHGKVKVELGLAKGKKLYDKRDDLAEKDALREVQRMFKDRHEH